MHPNYLQQFNFKSNNFKISDSVCIFHLLSTNIKQCYIIINKLQYFSDFPKGVLANLLNHHEWHNFLTSQVEKNERPFQYIKQKNINKINLLIQKHSSLYRSYKHIILSNSHLWFNNLTNLTIPDNIKYSLCSKFST